MRQVRHGPDPRRADRATPPRVVHVIDNMRVGGAQRLLVTLARHLRTHDGLNVIELEGRSSLLRDELIAAGANLQSLSGLRLMNPLSVLKLRQAIRATGAEVVHLHLTYATILGALAARSVGCRVVVSLHNVDTVGRSGVKGWLLRALESFVLRHHCDHVIHVGDEVCRANAARLGATPQTTVHNVLPVPRNFAPQDVTRLRQRLGAADGDLVLLSTGRLSPQKDHLTLLSAFAEVLSQFPNAKLWIAGTGDLRTRLEEVASDLGLGQQVQFLGARPDVPALLAASDVFVMSSAWEGLPLGLLEAMVQECAVVSTDVGDVRAVVSKGAGLLVPPKHPKELAEALLAACRSPGLRRRLGKKARRVTRPFTDVATWFERIQRTYATDPKALEPQAADRKSGVV